MQKYSIAVARTGLFFTLCNGIASNLQTATEEDRGEYNKDPDWLIKQSVVRQVARGGGGCYSAQC